MHTHSETLALSFCLVVTCTHAHSLSLLDIYIYAQSHMLTDLNFLRYIPRKTCDSNCDFIVKKRKRFCYWYFSLLVVHLFLFSYHFHFIYCVFPGKNWLCWKDREHGRNSAGDTAVWSFLHSRRCWWVKHTRAHSCTHTHTHPQTHVHMHAYTHTHTTKKKKTC